MKAERAEAVWGAPGFRPAERRRLLAAPGIGPGVLARLEQSGFHSIESIRRRGVDAVVDEIAAGPCTQAWKNRRRALERAVQPGADEAG